MRAVEAAKNKFIFGQIKFFFRKRFFINIYNFITWLVAVWKINNFF